MLADIPIITPMPMEGPEANSAIMNVVTFVEKHLSQFAKKYAGSSIKNENGLNQGLCLLLNNYARIEYRSFFFEKEFMENVEKGNSPKVDFGVLVFSVNSEFYNIHESFFSMEAKRLCQTGKAREKEYLIGRVEAGTYKHCGGVERFKTAIHGKNLQYGAVIGYVQAYNFHYWERKIDGWIDELIVGKIFSCSYWSEKDKIQLLNQTASTAKYRSENSRKNGSIILFHLWVNLNPDHLEY